MYRMYLIYLHARVETDLSSNPADYSIIINQLNNCKTQVNKVMADGQLKFDSMEFFTRIEPRGVKSPIILPPPPPRGGGGVGGGVLVVHTSVTY